MLCYHGVASPAEVGLQVSATIAVGLAEGLGHTNWKLLFVMLLWWGVGFFTVIGITALLLAQGELWERHTVAFQCEPAFCAKHGLSLLFPGSLLASF